MDRRSSQHHVRVLRCLASTEPSFPVLLPISWFTTQSTYEWRVRTSSEVWLVVVDLCTERVRRSCVACISGRA
jgi:hypothetical protein